PEPRGVPRVRPDEDRAPAQRRRPPARRLDLELAHRRRTGEPDAAAAAADAAVVLRREPAPVLRGRDGADERDDVAREPRRALARAPARARAVSAVRDRPVRVEGRPYRRVPRPALRSAGGA